MQSTILWTVIFVEHQKTRAISELFKNATIANRATLDNFYCNLEDQLFSFYQRHLPISLIISSLSLLVSLKRSSLLYCFPLTFPLQFVGLKKQKLRTFLPAPLYSLYPSHKFPEFARGPYYLDALS